MFEVCTRKKIKVWAVWKWGNRLRKRRGHLETRLSVWEDINGVIEMTNIPVSGPNCNTGRRYEISSYQGVILIVL